MQFLQNLSALRASGKNTQMDRGETVIEDTALNMIECVVEAHREAGRGRLGDISQLGRLLQASRLVAQALERGVCKQKVLEKAEELLEELLQLLLNNSQLNKVGDLLAFLHTCSQKLSYSHHERGCHGKIGLSVITLICFFFLWGRMIVLHISLIVEVIHFSHVNFVICI